MASLPLTAVAEGVVLFSKDEMAKIVKTKIGKREMPAKPYPYR
jgi:hypothetical protein